MEHPLKISKSELENGKRWHGRHWFTVALLVEKNNLSLQKLPNYFLYNNLRCNQPGFCILFAKDEICHPEKEKTYFSCLFCSCPFFWPCMEEKTETIDKNCIFAASLSELKNDENKTSLPPCDKCVFIHDINWVKKNIHLAAEEIQKILLRK